MTCPWLERVALAMDGEWTPEVEAHVGECAECSGLLEDREVLQSAPPLPRVVSIRAPQRKLTWWPAAIAAAAAAVVVGFAVQPPAVDPMPPVAMRHPVAPTVTVSEEVAQVRQPVRQHRPVRRSAPSFDAERLAGSLVAALHRPMDASEAVTIYTDDPDVVIMLLPSRGDEDDE